MKKNLVLMVMAGVALASCVNDEVEEIVQEPINRKITFESPLAYTNGSRAHVKGEIANPYPQDETFMIYATEYEVDNYTGWTGARASDANTVFFNNTEVTFDTSVDGWAPKKDDQGYYYWTDGNYMAFAACSPYNLNLSEKNEKPADNAADLSTTTYRYYDKDGLTIKNFKVAETSTEQYDLLFSRRLYDQDAGDMVKVEGQYSGIQLTFQHALSSIHFSLLNETLLSTDPKQHETIILKDISVKNVYTQGTFKEKITESETVSEDGESKTVYNMKYDKTEAGNVKPEWSDQSEEANYSAYKDGDVDLEFPSVQQYVSDYIGKLEKDNPTNKGKYGEAIPLLLLPQDLPENALIEVKYKIKEHTDEDVLTKTIKFHDLKDPNGKKLSEEWKIGTKYTYRLVYTKETSKKDRIYFAPSTEAWDDGGIIVVNL